MGEVGWSSSKVDGVFHRVCGAQRWAGWRSAKMGGLVLSIFKLRKDGLN